MPSYAVLDINSNSWGVDQVTSTHEQGTDGEEGTIPVEAVRCVSSAPMELGPKPRDHGIPPLHLRGCLRIPITGTRVKGEEINE